MAGEMAVGAAAPPAATVARLAFMTAVGEVLASTLELPETLERTVRLAVPELADTCSIELLRDGRLEVAAIADVDPAAEAVLRRHAAGANYTDDANYPPRRVVESGQPMLVPEVPPDLYERFIGDPEQRAFLVSRRVGTGICVPLQARGIVLGSLSMARLAGRRAYGPDDLGMATDLAHRAALAIDSAQQFAAAQAEVDARRRSEEVQHFLAEITRALVTEHDYDANLQTLARLSVPFLADICLIDAAGGDGIRRIAARHHHPGAQPLVDALGERYPPDPTGRHPAVRAIFRGERSFAPHMSDEFLRDTTRDDDHYRIVRDLGFTSYICVPLIARGRVLGAFTVISCNASRRFDADDVSLVEDVATRAALVLDMARLLAERTTVARTLQRTLLPSALPAIAGVSLAARYRAVGEGIEVGGDFYDAFRGADGEWVLAVGDVCGKGPAAAAVTGLVRNTLRAVAPYERDPHRVLRRLNDILLDNDVNEHFCTLVYAVLTPDGSGVRLQVISAGHPSPLLRRADGRVHEVANQGTLLGALDDVMLADPTLVKLSPGEVLVFYTDGVTEARGADGIFGERGLRGAVGSAPSDPEAIADAVVDAVDAHTSGVARDDIAVLAVGISG